MFIQTASNRGFSKKLKLQIFIIRSKTILNSRRKYDKICLYDWDFLEMEALQILVKLKESLSLISLSIYNFRLYKEDLLRIMRFEKLKALRLINVAYERVCNDQPLNTTNYSGLHLWIGLAMTIPCVPRSRISREASRSTARLVKPGHGFDDHLWPDPILPLFP
jgi:hypothetical protein